MKGMLFLWLFKEIILQLFYLVMTNSQTLMYFYLSGSGFGSSMDLFCTNIVQGLSYVSVWW